MNNICERCCKSEDMCSCGYFNCDPLLGRSRKLIQNKIDKRKELGLCIGCGHEICKCKSSKKEY